MSIRAWLGGPSRSLDRSGFSLAKATAPLAAILALLVGLPPAVAASSPPATAEAVTAFQAFVAAFRPEALAHDIPSALYDETLATLTPDPAVAALTRRQPEEVKTVGAYLAGQVTAARITASRARLDRWRADLAAVETRFGVPAPLLVAVWALESNFGASGGSKDVVRSMATLAAANYRPDLYRTELLAALTLLRDGEVARDSLRGSWAGAMGQPQFMPSSFIRYAVDQDGDGRRDIWTSVPDTLASIANFIKAQGWQRGQPWGFEVVLPPRVDLRDSRRSFSAWAALGVRRVGGTPMPEEGTGILYFPAGAAGPAFLVTANFEVIKTYNFSDAYVLSVGLLADRMMGGPPVQARWPDDRPLSRDERIALQGRLVARGYAVDDRQGRISLALRDVIRTAQASVGQTVDGNPSRALLQALAPP